MEPLVTEHKALLVFRLNAELVVVTGLRAEVAAHQVVAAVMVETEFLAGTALAAAERVAIRVAADRGPVAIMDLMALAAAAVAARAVGSMVTKLLAVDMIF
jgi:hypothetical protein